MKNYYQVKAVASAPPKGLIAVGKVVCVIGLLISLGGPLLAWLLSFCVNHVPSFPFIYLGLFLFIDGLLLVSSASRQQKELLNLRQSLLKDNPQITVSAEEFMSQRKALIRQDEVTGVFIIHNVTKDLFTTLDKEQKRLIGPPCSFSLWAIVMCTPTSDTATRSMCVLSRCLEVVMRASLS